MCVCGGGGGGAREGGKGGMKSCNLESCGGMGGVRVKIRG